MTVNHSPPSPEPIPPERRLYTAAEVLEVALAAYERGLYDAHVQVGRTHWRTSDVVEAFRLARVRAEILDMKRRATERYEAYGYPRGYDYRGGPVDWLTGMPEGSGCAWLRRKQTIGLVAA